MQTYMGENAGVVTQLPPTEFRSRLLDSQQRSKQVESLISDLKQVMDHLNEKGGARDAELEDATKKLKTTARGLNDAKLEAVVAKLADEIYQNPVFKTSTAAGLQHPYIDDIKDFFRENNYIFIVTQPSAESREWSNIDYLFGKVGESRIHAYGNTGVRADFVEDVVTNKSEYLVGYAPKSEGSVIVVRNDDYKRMIARREATLERAGEEERKLVDNFKDVSSREVEEYARSRSASVNVAMTEVVLLKLTQDYLKREEKPEEKEARVKKNVERMNEYHEVGEKIILMKTHGEESFLRERKKQEVRTEEGLKEVYVIKGPPILAVGERSRFNPSESEYASDLVALVKEPKVTLINNVERYQSLLSQAPENEKIRKAYPQYFEASRQFVEGIVKYVEEYREKFPDVKKSGVLILGELDEKQLSEIGKALLEKKYSEKGYALDSSQIF
ncbi:hypothetical protein H0N99_02730 [Candidatus Micrarchaeota archaeon]|nr:hypothetical protein [Candidatus Micrarchaeota archaeon]